MCAPLHLSKFAMDILKSVDFMEISFQRSSQGRHRRASSPNHLIVKCQLQIHPLQAFVLVDMEILDSVFKILPDKKYF